MSGTDPDDPRDQSHDDDALPPTHQPYGQEPPPPPRPGQEPWSPPPPPPHEPPAYQQQAPYQQPYQQPYGAAPAYGYGAGQPPMHPQATTSMVLGIASLAGLITCQLLLVLGPVAWVMGSRACREIDAAPGRWSGRDRANAGRIMGLIGTVLLVLSVLAVVALLVAVIAFGAWDSSDTGVDVNVNALTSLAGLSGLG